MRVKASQNTSIGLDKHIINADVEFHEGDGWWFPIAAHISARFAIKEGEPIPPEGWVVDWVSFGGEFMTVHYHATRPLRVFPDCFYAQEAKDFESYRQGIIDFLKYRAKLLSRR